MACMGLSFGSFSDICSPFTSIHDIPLLWNCQVFKFSLRVIAQLLHKWSMPDKSSTSMTQTVYPPTIALDTIKPAETIFTYCYILRWESEFSTKNRVADMLHYLCMAYSANHESFTTQKLSPGLWEASTCWHLCQWTVLVSAPPLLSLSLLLVILCFIYINLGGYVI